MNISKSTLHEHLLYLNRKYHDNRIRFRLLSKMCNHHNIDTTAHGNGKLTKIASYYRECNMMVTLVPLYYIMNELREVEREFSRIMPNRTDRNILVLVVDV